MIYVQAPPPHHYIHDPREHTLKHAQKKARKWAKCQMITGYLIAGVSGITVLTNAFIALHLDNWSEIPFPDSKGYMHRIHLPTGGLLFLTLVKILSVLVTLKWGCEAIKTFKPIVKEIEREEIHGVSQEHRHVTNSQSINNHRSKVIKFMLWTFALLAL